MSILKNIKLNYTTKLLNQSIEKKDFANFRKSFEDLKEFWDETKAEKPVWREY